MDSHKISRVSEVDRSYLIYDHDITYANSLGIVFGIHIGKGCYADVFYTKYKDKKVALKTTHRSRCSKNTYESELKVSNVLKYNNHENVVRIVEILSNSDETLSWILMEWVDGEDMNQIRKRRHKPFSESVAKDYFRQLIAGIQFLHSLGIVHRDIKPHNVLIYRNREQQKDVIKYIDFGFAKLVPIDNENKAMCSSHKGSQIYMAPELMSDTGLTYDAFKVDIYSLAIVLYEMLFDELPFGTSDMGVDKEERNDLMQKLKENLIIRYPEKFDVSEDAKHLIENMIACESKQRYSLQQIIDSKWLKN